MLKDGSAYTLNNIGLIVVAPIYRESPNNPGCLDLLTPTETGLLTTVDKGNSIVVPSVSFYLREGARHNKEFVWLDEDPQVLRDYADSSQPPDTEELPPIPPITEGNEGNA